MEYLQATPKGVYCGNQPLLLQGMGLGGWLLPEGYMWKFYTKCDRPRRMETLIADLCGEAYAKAFWDCYYDTYITEKDIAWIAAQGLNSVRIPINARHLFYTAVDGSVAFYQPMLQRLDSGITWCKKYGIYAFIDMHAAPGGQTGQNIDDSANDEPELFCEEKHRTALVAMWKLLAARYAHEPTVGGYDLLNEPLPKWHGKYNEALLPLYRRLIQEIRAIDTRHIIILEGLHWSTDFSVFDAFTPQETANNIMLQFHKYWSNPDEESLASFIAQAKRLQVPLWMGEGGENNLAWYTTVFPLYEQLGIGWCFWSYKKMDCQNSPVSFRRPQGWQTLIDYLDGGEKPDAIKAKKLFDDFLGAIADATYRDPVIQALLRRPPVTIPSFAFAKEKIKNPKEMPAPMDFRAQSNAHLVFADGHCGTADWCRYGGESQPDSQRIYVHLKAGDAVAYGIRALPLSWLYVTLIAHGTGQLTLQQQQPTSELTWKLSIQGEKELWLACIQGEVWVEALQLRYEETEYE